MENSIVLGVDIGGSHITAALVNLQTKSIIKDSKVREYVNSKGGAPEIIQKWISVITASFHARDLNEKRIGIAMPGPFDYEDGISLMQNQDKYDALYGFNVKNILAENLNISKANIRFLNDAECFLKGEVFGGAARGVKKAIGLTLGTGLGSSRYQNGLVEDADLWCSPFLDGIAEDYLSTRWFTKRYTGLTGTEVKDVKEIINLESSGTVRQQLFNEFGKNLALFLNKSMVEDQPEAIILGGNISNAYALFKEELKVHLSDAFIKTVIQQTALGEDSCLIGAASAWHQVIAEVIES